MAGLFAAQRVAAAQHLLQHVAVAHRGLHGGDAHVLQGQLQAQVAHDGHHQRIVGQLALGLLGPGQDAHDLVAVDHVAVLVHGQAAVGVAIEGHAHHGVGGLDHGLQLLGVGGAGVLVDVVAIRRGVDHHHLGARTAQRLRGHHRGGAVRAVGHDLQPLERLGLGLVRADRGDGGDQVVDIQVGGGHRVMADASHAGAGGTFPVLAEHRLDLVFLGVGQLESAACEELDAVIRHRIVGG